MFDAGFVHQNKHKHKTYENLKNSTGIYIAYTSAEEPQSVYKAQNYQGMVNRDNTKFGITCSGFGQRYKCYENNFGEEELAYIPVASVDPRFLKDIEKKIKSAVKAFGIAKVKHTREWLVTTNRALVIEIIGIVLANSGVDYKWLV